MSRSQAIAVNRAVKSDISRRKRAVERLQGAVDIAIDALIEIAAKGEKDSDRRAAAAEILDRAGIIADKAPATNINVSVTGAQLDALRDLAVQAGPIIDHKPLKTLDVSTHVAKQTVKHVTLDALTAAASEEADSAAPGEAPPPP